VSEVSTEAPSASSTPRAKHGLPRVSLVVAETYARGVWEAARQGTAPPISVARAISGRDDVLASGGGWRAKVAALRVFHLMDKHEGQMKLSEIGLAVVNTGDTQNQCDGRRRALLGVEPYATVLRQSNGHPLPTSGSLAGRFEFDYSLATEDAKVAAEAFIESVKHAGMLDADGRVVMEGVPPASPEPPIEEKDTRDIEITSYANRPEAETPKNELPRFAAFELPLQPRVTRGTGSVEIAVTINMTKWPIEDILTVLDVFGYPPQSGNDE